MSPKENGMQLLYMAQRDSRVDKIPRIEVSSSGRRYGIRVRTPLKKMSVPVYRRIFTRRTKQKRVLACDLTFYVTGKALVVQSMKWTLMGAKGANRKEIPVDADACEVIVRTLKEIATRHKVPSIYVDQNDVPHAILSTLGFSPMGSHDAMHLDVSKPEQKH
ncbi:MAG: hypothetical protein GY852_07670 [bacterium]|nr:hypothetical protein [bacterium]